MLKENIVLSAKNISKQFTLSKAHGTMETFTALNNLSFEIEKGKTVGLIGANGAGKSTLLKIISETIAPSSGEIEYQGTLLPILEVGTGFHADLSGYDNIFFNAALFGFTKERTQLILNEIIEFSGIRSFIHEPVKNYSSGMYLRLALSIALHIDFDIILLDEVIAVGDLEFRTKALAKIKERIKQGKTCILISHDLQSIVNLCDQCIILEKGEIVFNGTANKAAQVYLKQLEENKNKEATRTECKQCRYIFTTTAKTSYALDEDIELKIKFEKKVTTDIDIVIKIKSFAAHLISDCIIYRPDYNNHTTEVGLYEVVCKIPKNTFDRGIFYIDLLFGDKINTLLEIKNALSFETILPAWEKNKRWNEGSDNIPLRPRLEWEAKKVTN